MLSLLSHAVDLAIDCLDASGFEILRCKLVFGVT